MTLSRHRCQWPPRPSRRRGSPRARHARRRRRRHRPRRPSRSPTSPTAVSQVRRADYTDPASLDAAFVGVDRLLLVSGSEVGQRVAQHANVIDAAKRAGVELRRLHEHHPRRHLRPRARRRAPRDRGAARRVRPAARAAAQLLVPRELHRSAADGPRARRRPRRRRRGPGQRRDARRLRRGCCRRPRRPTTRPGRRLRARWRRRVHPRRSTPALGAASGTRGRLPRPARSPSYTAALVAAGLPEGYAARARRQRPWASPRGRCSPTPATCRVSSVARRPDLEDALRAALVTAA